MPEQKDKELEVLYSLLDRLVGATTGEWRANRPLDEVHDEALAHIRTYECMALSCHQHNHTFSPATHFLELRRARAVKGKA